MADALQRVIDGRIETAHEDGSYRCQPPRVTPTKDVCLQSFKVGLCDRSVLLHREDESHVHVNPLGQHPADGPVSGLGGGDFDHHVGPVQKTEKPQRLADGPLRIVGQTGIHLEAHVTGQPVALLVIGPEGICDPAYILDHEVFVNLVRRQSLPGHLGQIPVVIGAACNGFLENRGIRSDTPDALPYHILKLSGIDEGPPDIVEPDLLALPGKLSQTVHDWTSSAKFRMSENLFLW